MGTRSFLSPGRVSTIESQPVPVYSVAQMESDMGLMAPYVVMGTGDQAAGTGVYSKGKTRGILNRGFRTYGDSLYTSYLNNLAVYPNNPSQTRDWSELQVWHAVFPAKGNTSTNVCVRIQNFQAFWLHKTTHVWTPINVARLYANTNEWHDLAAYTDGKVTADRILQSGNPIPGFPVVRYAADRNAPSADETKYRTLHSVFNGGGSFRFAMPAVNNPSGGNLGGFMLTCEVDLFPISGSTFNGVTQIVMQLGSDFMYPGGNQGAGDMAFATPPAWTPNTTSSKYCFIDPTIGVKTRVHCTTFWDEQVNGSGVALNTKVAGHMGGSGASKETSVFAEAGGVFWLTHQQLLDYPITFVP